MAAIRLSKHLKILPIPMHFTKRFFLAVNFLRYPWWIKVSTQAPNCLYYFGPFDSKEEAQALQSSYVKDLLDEGAKDIHLVIEKAGPEQLTICETEDMDYLPNAV